MSRGTGRVGPRSPYLGAIVAAVQAPATIAVQVVNYRTRSYLERCLATVVPDVRRSGLDYEINLLDNASGEALEDFPRSFDACRAFTAERNLGFGGGHNLLASKTEARYLLILNPDVEFLLPDTTTQLVAAMVSIDRVWAVGPKLITASGTAQPYDHGRLRGVRAQISLRGGHSYWHETDVRQDVAWVSGAVMLIERAAFAKVGGFDEKLFLYKEDEDLCLRLRQEGGRVLYEPSVVIRHHGSVVADRQVDLKRASAYFSAKHLPNRRSRRLFEAVHHLLPYLRL
ncbi:MAG: glycosyltransferase family 2 protein [Solirubrobacterales bacterium]|nr:glycosyltransferase family 2 protein [Solirubrobacterales bacterium]